jgi:hypothetical protein
MIFTVCGDTPQRYLDDAKAPEAISRVYSAAVSEDMLLRVLSRIRGTRSQSTGRNIPSPDRAQMPQLPKPYTYKHMRLHRRPLLILLGMYTQLQQSAFNH